MKIIEKIDFNDELFHYVDKQRQGLIYKNDDSTRFLKVYYEKNKLKKLYYTEEQAAGTQELFRVKKLCSNDIEVMFKCCINEKVYIDGVLYDNYDVDYKRNYDILGNLLVEKIIIYSPEGKQLLRFRKNNDEDTLFLDNDSVTHTFKTDNLYHFESLSNDLVQEFINLNKSQTIQNKQVSTKSKIKAEPLDDTIYNIPDQVFIYDRAYQIDTKNFDTISYINNQDGLHKFDIKIDRVNNRIGEIVFIDYNQKSNISSCYPIKRIVRISPQSDNTIKGVYTTRDKENLIINNEKYQNTKTNGKGILDLDNRKLNCELEITLDKGKIQLYNSQLAHSFTDKSGENNYYLTSVNYAYFESILYFSHSIIDNLEQKIFKKEMNGD